MHSLQHIRSNSQGRGRRAGQRLDSGASFHMAGSAHEDAAVPAQNPVCIQTVGGDFTFDKEVDQDTKVGQVRSLLTPGGPDVVSMGRLIREKPYTFVWSDSNFEKPCCTTRRTTRRCSRCTAPGSGRCLAW